MKTLKLLFSFIAVLFFVWACTGEDKPASITNTYYVSPDGNDSATGLSPDQAWKSIERVNICKLVPGDQVLFESGASFSGTLWLSHDDSASASQPIVISSFGNGYALIDGGKKAGFIAEKCNNFSVTKMHFKGEGRKDGNSTDGIIVSECENVAIDSVEVFGFQHSGISIFKCNDVKITYAYAHDNGFAGIHISGTTIWDKENYDNNNIYIAYCTAENNPGDPTVLANHSGNGILASSVKGGKIEYCEAFNNGWDMPWHGNGPVGIWIWDCTDFVIQHCISHDNKTAAGAADGGGFDLDGGVSESVIQYCLSYNNQGAGIGLFEFGAGKVWENNIIRYNISQNDGTNGTASVNIWKGDAGGTIRNCEIYNNTFYNSEGANLSFLNNWSGFNFRNNIFIYSGSILVRGQKVKDELFSHNLYWNLKDQNTFLGHQDLEAWARATGKEMSEGNFTGIYADPLLQNPGGIQLTDPTQLSRENLAGYVPAAGSPVIDAGLVINIPTAVHDKADKDISATSVPQGNSYDIGALEIRRSAKSATSSD
jgi:hypothetical protein